MKQLRLSILFPLLIMFSCVTSTYVYFYPHPRYQNPQLMVPANCDVSTFRIYRFLPDSFQHDTIGKCTVKAEGESLFGSSVDKVNTVAMKKLKECACKNGGDAVLIGYDEMNRTDVHHYPGNPPYTYPTSYSVSKRNIDLEGMVIKYK